MCDVTVTGFYFGRRFASSLLPISAESVFASELNWILPDRLPEAFADAG